MTGDGGTRTTPRTDYTREELIAICEQASVPQEKWRNRDSAEAQKQVGECWAWLRAGCAFTIEIRPEGEKYEGKSGCYTDDKTIWVTVFAEGFAYTDGGGELDEELSYLPTPERLAAAVGCDWY